jgi:hypothetical protein
LRLRLGPIREKLHTWLQIFLIAGVLVYVYSPLLDHLLEKDVYSRPHTHFHVAGSVLPQLAQFHERDFIAGYDPHDEQDEGFICFLNVDVLLSLMLSIFIMPHPAPEPRDPLVTDLVTTYLDVSLVYLSSIDPPPNL